MDRHPVALSVAALVAASLVPIPRADAVAAAPSARTSVSCLFALPGLGGGRDALGGLTAARLTRECADGPLAVVAPLSQPTAIAPSVATLPTYDPFGTARSAAAEEGDDRSRRTETSIALVIVEDAPPDLGVFPGRIQPIPVSPKR